MDILAPTGWFRLENNGRSSIVMAPTIDQIHWALTTCRASSEPRQSTYCGYRMYEARVSTKSLQRLFTALLQASTSRVDRTLVNPFCESRLSLLDHLSYPVTGRVSDQEFASQAMASCPVLGSWDCDCGRRVPDDGAPCICGKEKK